MSHQVITLVIDNDTIDKYAEYYFQQHPRARKKPIPYPYHESINKWMIMKRPAMNALKQKWKDFIVWFVNDKGYANLRIEKCELHQTIYFPNNRRHDNDNTVPKFIQDGLVEAGMVVDDDCLHIQALSLRCFLNDDNPRTELMLIISE